MKLDIGSRVGRLLITGPTITVDGKRSLSPVVCDCGAVLQVRRDALRSGRTTSCGCRRREEFIRRSTKHGHSGRTASTPEYRAWASMIQRCTNRQSKAFEWYGARGISVCERWKDFPSFLADMGSRPPGTSIERIENEGNYEPGNCKWATREEQMRNTRRNGNVVFNGKTMCATDAARALGIPPGRIFWRVHKHGVSHQEAFDAIRSA